jgi:ubiquinol-cytochrome c reductase cytochrome b subunit
VPVLGPSLVIWLWGDFCVRQITLRFFYSIHFLLPLVIFVVVLFHLIYLHETGSKNKSFNNSKLLFCEFSNYLLPKDYLNLFIVLIIVLVILG